MIPLTRRQFCKMIECAAAGLVVGHSISYAESLSNQKPNIIFIMTDDMGYTDLGCYGSKTISTPNLDRMAAEGMRFTEAYSGCTVCAPARSTLMTGKHMGHTPIRGNTGGIPLSSSDVTVAEVLKKAGYATGGFGKWGLGDLDTAGVPEKQGFDVFYGYYHQIHAHSYFPEYLIRSGKKEPLPENLKDKNGQYSHYLIFEETLNFIRENHTQPFFCYASWTPPHARYELPDSELALKIYADKAWPEKDKVIAAMITMMDRQVGQIFDLLKELGIDNNTIVFFTSDNGTAGRVGDTHNSSGPLKGHKKNLYEGGIRVPMIVRWPENIKAGSESDLPWYFPDVMPTLADLAGASAYMSKDIDGISVLPTLLNSKKQEDSRYLYWEWPYFAKDIKGIAVLPSPSEEEIEKGLIYTPNRLMQAVRYGKWKMVKHAQNQSWELYDLSQDIAEQHNIAADHPEIIANLSEWIRMNRVEPSPQIEPAKPPDQKYR